MDGWMDRDIDKIGRLMYERKDVHSALFVVLVHLLASHQICCVALFCSSSWMPFGSGCAWITSGSKTIDEHDG